jgi:hypothetical protein
LASLVFNALFIQEHKLWQEDWTFLGKRIWKQGKFFVSPAEDGLHTLRNDNVVAGRGGLAIAISKQLKPFVTYDMVSPCKRAILIHLDGLPFGSLGLLNVYGPNDAQDRAALWEALSHLVDPSRPWLVGGDFNMVLYSTDQLEGLPADLSGAEAVHGHYFLLHLVYLNTSRLLEVPFSIPGTTFVRMLWKNQLH